MSDLEAIAALYQQLDNSLEDLREQHDAAGEAGWSCRPTLLGDIAEETAKVPETDIGLVDKRYGLSKVGPPRGG